jgi:tetratricopeptide (TPR) repeat protein
MQKETKLIIALMAITFALSFSVYLKTLAPTVSFGDSGDFISAAYVLGICHPPGYPLYLLCAKLFSWLPVGTNIAFRINLMSAVFAAFTVSLLYLLIYRIQQWFYPEEISLRGNRSFAVSDWVKHLVAVVGVLSFAFSASFWSQAVIAEVHTLNAAFTIGLILTILAFVRFGELRFLYTASLLWGLAFGVHQTSILYLPVILLFFGVKGVFKKVFKLQTLLVLIALAFLGWAVHLYFPLVAVRNPARNWDNPTNWLDFAKLIGRADYNKFRWSRSLSLAWEQTGSAGFTLISQFTIYFYWLGVVGLWRMVKKDWKVAGFLFLLALSIWLFFSAVTNFPMEHNIYVDTREAFFIPAYLFYTIWLALGLRGLWIFSKQYAVSSKPYIVDILLSVCCLLIPLVILLTHYKEQDKSEYYLAYDLGQAILETLQPNALYFAEDDPFIFPVYYLQLVESHRPDVTTIPRSTMYKWWFYAQLKKSNPNKVIIPAFEPDKTKLWEIYLDTKLDEFATLNLDKHPIYFLYTLKQNLNPKFKIIRTGMLYQIVTTVPAESANIGVENYLPPPTPYRYRGKAANGLSTDDWTQIAVLQFCNFHIRQGDYFAAKKKFEKAIEEYFIATNIKPNSVEAYYHLGILYGFLEDTDRARKAYENVLLLKPDYPEVKKKLEILKNPPK